MALEVDVPAEPLWINGDATRLSQVIGNLLHNAQKFTDAGGRVVVRAAADADAETRQLVAALGSLELHDPCGCVVVRATVAHRIGRDGVDAWLAVDLPLAGR